MWVLGNKVDVVSNLSSEEFFVLASLSSSYLALKLNFERYI